MNLENMSCNLNHELKCFFIHNPKTGGKTVRNLIAPGNEDRVSHLFPTRAVKELRIWEEYFTFVFIRHPLERLVSSWAYHMSDTYRGGYYNKLKHLEKHDISGYFHTVTKMTPYCVSPQYNYTYHEKSDMPIDFIGRFENYENDLKKIMQRLGIKKPINHLNKSKHGSWQEHIPRSLLMELIDYYQEDFNRYGYEI